MSYNYFRGFKNLHIWFSVVNHEPTSNFTTVQRLSCCLCLLMTIMLTNIMFYGVDETPGVKSLDVGFFSFSWIELRIGNIFNVISRLWFLVLNLTIFVYSVLALQTLFIVWPINLLIIFLFRRVSPKHGTRARNEHLFLQPVSCLSQRSGAGP